MSNSHLLGLRTCAWSKGRVGRVSGICHLCLRHYRTGKGFFSRMWGSGLEIWRGKRGSVPREAPTREAPLLCSGGEGLCGGSGKEGHCSTVGGPGAGLSGLLKTVPARSALPRPPAHPGASSLAQQPSSAAAAPRLTAQCRRLAREAARRRLCRCRCRGPPCADRGLRRHHLRSCTVVGASARPVLRNPAAGGLG